MGRTKGAGYMNPMFILFALATAVLLFLGSLLALEVGRRIGAPSGRRERQGDRRTWRRRGRHFRTYGVAPCLHVFECVTGFDLRRQLIVDEANAIATAYTNLDLLPAEAQSTFRDLFRQYLSARVDVYRTPRGFSLRRNMTLFAPEPLERGQRLQAEIWKEAVANCPPGSSRVACVLLLPAISKMTEVARIRTAVNQRHPPHIGLRCCSGLESPVRFWQATDGRQADAQLGTHCRHRDGARGSAFRNHQYRVPAVGPYSARRPRSRAVRHRQAHA